MEGLVLSTGSPAHLTFQSTGEIQKHGRGGVCFTDRIKKALKTLTGMDKERTKQERRQVEARDTI